MVAPRHASADTERAWLNRAVAVSARLGGSAAFRRLAALVSAGVMVLAIGLAWRALRDVEPAEVLAALGSTPLVAVAASVLFTVVSYGCLAIQEWCEIWLLARRLPKARTALTSFAANSLSGAIGFGLASGPAVRLRLYRWSGLGARKIALVALVRSLATYVGGIVAMGLVILLDPAPLATALGSPLAPVLAGAILLMAPGLLWFLALRKAGPGSRPPRPGARTRALALGAGIADWISSGLALFVLTGQGAAALPPFLAVFCLGSLVGGIAGVPAGLGVLEATVLSLHGSGLMHETAAALILYRAIYFLGPLVATSGALGLNMLVRRAGRLTPNPRAGA